MTGFVAPLHPQGGVLASDGSEGGCFERTRFDSPDCCYHCFPFLLTALLDNSIARTSGGRPSIGPS